MGFKFHDCNSCILSSNRPPNDSGLLESFGNYNDVLFISAMTVYVFCFMWWLITELEFIWFVNRV